jgi:hypothetical protein
MFYRTRHLRAAVDMSHDDKLVRVGEAFVATEVDAKYYLDKKLAVEPTEQVAVEQPRRRGRPRKVAE